jgi:hypothetical protein
VPIDTLSALRASGVRITLDNFGTGYSSLYHLRNFDLDKIKIDRSFIQAMATDPESASIVNALAGLGRGLGLTVAADGIDSNGTRNPSARQQLQCRSGDAVSRTRRCASGPDAVSRIDATKSRSDERLPPRQYWRRGSSAWQRNRHKDRVRRQGMGPAAGTALFAAVLIAQIWARVFNPWLYWATIVASLVPAATGDAGEQSACGRPGCQNSIRCTRR